jgi:hypothetical protein
VTGILPPFFWRGVAARRGSLIGLESGVEDLQLGVVRFQLAVSGFQIQDVGDADHGSAANFVPVNGADNWLHFGLGAAMIVLGLTLARLRDPTKQRTKIGTQAEAAAPW